VTIKQRHLTIIVCLALGVFVADQITKELIKRTIEYNSVFFAGHDHDFFWLTHQRNEGLVGGAFRDVPMLALGLSLAATGVLIYLYRHLCAESKWQSIAYGLVVGGAAGNMLDRLRDGYVTDFIQVYFHFIPFDFPWKLYPAFNIADSGICVGVVLLMITWRHADLANPADVSSTH
jgi:signal peptidase II